MNNELYFHDGNFISISIDEFDKAPVCKLILSLYSNANASNRSSYIICITNFSRLSLLGDFSEINKNYFAGSIEDGDIREMGNIQRLRLQITGGYLEVFGEISVKLSQQ